MIRQMPSTALILSVMDMLLLSLFLPADPAHTPKKKALIALAGVALLFVPHLFETRDEGVVYLYTIALYLLLLPLCAWWSGLSLSRVMTRALAFLVLTECVLLAISYASLLLVGRDIFRTAPLRVRLPAVALLTAAQVPLLLGLRRLFPPKPCVNGLSNVLSLLSAIPYLFSFQITFWLSLSMEQLTVAIFPMLIFSCLLSLMLIVIQERQLFAEKEKREALAVSSIARLQQQQYAASRHSAEAVRRNYHDMKNLLLYLENVQSRDDIRAHVRQIMDDIRPYETVLDTGSEVMDILLSEKLAQCQGEGIACTIMADGAALAFIKPLDLVTMLGNAMDNAIEACRRMPGGSTRYIQVRTARRQGFLLLSVRNSCTGEANLQGGRFMTTKADSENHGFGLLSIRRCAEGYGGEMTCRMQDGEFALTLLFPCEEGHAPESRKTD